MPTFGLQLVTGPTIEPVSIEECRDFLRITGDDATLARLRSAVRESVEDYLQRQLITATYDYFLDCFPPGGRSTIEMPRPPLISVTTVKYYDTDDSQQTWTDTNYNVDTNTEPGRIQPIESQYWPSTINDHSAVEIRFVCGYGATRDSVPETIKLAILNQIGLWYNNREGQSVLSDGVMAMLDAERWAVQV